MPDTILHCRRYCKLVNNVSGSVDSSCCKALVVDCAASFWQSIGDSVMLLPGYVSLSVPCAVKSAMKIVAKCAAICAVLVLHTLPAVAQEPTATTAVETTTAAVATDVEATMKQMGLAYKQAMQATELAEFQRHARQFSELVASVQRYQFTADKQQFFMQGLDKLQQQTALALQATDLPSAQQQFRQIDALRKEYHQERSVSIWKLLFGG